MTFDAFSFDRRICAGINDCGYADPTPIQARVIPEVLAGKDVMGLARTGTGKTAAFALPILQKLMQKKSSRTGPVRVLVLAPTRELAQQIHQNFIALGKQTGMRSAAVYGGVGIQPQMKAVRNASIVTACPGRLLDLIDRGAVSLKHVDTLVLDEADRMMDMGFMPDIRRILSHLPAERQNLLFSATMPKEIERIAETILVDPVTVRVKVDSPIKTVSHDFYPVHQQQKTGLLEAMLKSMEYAGVLIFTRTKHKAAKLARILQNQGHKVASLQGDMSQSRRRQALDGFRKGTYKIMVATDIAARGIDCDHISHVINYDVPDTAETYTHRIGRTGRAGRTGCALSLITGEDTKLIRAVEHMLKQRIQKTRLEGFEYEQVPQFNKPKNPKATTRSFRPGKSYKKFNKSHSSKKRTAGAVA